MAVKQLLADRPYVVWAEDTYRVVLERRQAVLDRRTANEAAAFLAGALGIYASAEVLINADTGESMSTYLLAARTPATGLQARREVPKMFGRPFTISADIFTRRRPGRRPD